MGKWCPHAVDHSATIWLGVDGMFHVFPATQRSAPLLPPWTLGDLHKHLMTPAPPPPPIVPLSLTVTLPDPASAPVLHQAAAALGEEELNIINELKGGGQGEGGGGGGGGERRRCVMWRVGRGAMNKGERFQQGKHKGKNFGFQGEGAEELVLLYAMRRFLTQQHTNPPIYTPKMHISKRSPPPPHTHTYTPPKHRRPTHPKGRALVLHIQVVLVLLDDGGGEAIRLGLADSINQLLHGLILTGGLLAATTILCVCVWGGGGGGVVGGGGSGIRVCWVGYRAEGRGAGWGT
jgi:hypothetical protein